MNNNPQIVVESIFGYVTEVFGNDSFEATYDMPDGIKKITYCVCDHGFVEGDKISEIITIKKHEKKIQSLVYC